MSSAGPRAIDLQDSIQADQRRDATPDLAGTCACLASRPGTIQDVGRPAAFVTDATKPQDSSPLSIARRGGGSTDAWGRRATGGRKVSAIEDVPETRRSRSTAFGGPPPP